MLSTFLIILAYLMGSICSAVIVCKSCGLRDPRTQGSKNPGATNVLRIAGKQYAVMVLVADLLKGTIPVLIAKLLEADATTVAFTALAAVVGHMYPVFFDFKGGKGVATAMGALLGFQFMVGIMVAATWLLVVKITRYSSLASIISICLAPFYTLLITGQMDVFTPIFFIAFLVLLKHKDNISRLIDGTEPKIKLKQRSILEEVMDDDPDAQLILDEKVVAKVAVKAKKAPAKKVLAKKAPATKAKTAKTAAVKKTAKAEEPAKKKAKPAKKPAAAKTKTTKSKEK